MNELELFHFLRPLWLIAIPAILLNSPGTPEAAASALDGYPMAKRGEAIRAMKFALYSSVTGDTISDFLLIFLVVPFAAIALQFGPLEYTTVLLFAFAFGKQHWQPTIIGLTKQCKKERSVKGSR